MLEQSLGQLQNMVPVLLAIEVSCRTIAVSLINLVFAMLAL